jgi:DNA-binding NarL/FixJ family response regulator
MLVDDSTLFREGLANLLGAVGIEIAGTARTADEGIARIPSCLPDVVIMDIRMPPTFTDEGLVAAHQLKEKYPDLGVLLLSAHVEVASAARLLDGRHSGVGYLLKDRVDQVETLHDALARIRAGELVVDQDVVANLLRRRRNSSVLDDLSARERDVLQLIAEGRSNAAIAGQMHLAIKTIETNVAAIFGKLGLSQARDDNRRVLAVLAWLRARRT